MTPYLILAFLAGAGFASITLIIWAIWLGNRTARDARQRWDRIRGQVQEVSPSVPDIMPDDLR